MIELSTPKAYAAIGPLYGSTGRPLRCTVPPWQESEKPAGSQGWYYDLTDDHHLSQDPESLLVWLCDECAERLEDEGSVQFAGTDALRSTAPKAVCDLLCWHCDHTVAHTERTRR
jgi:hypothetical protein